MSISLFVWLWPSLIALLGLFVVSRYERFWRQRRVLAEAVMGLTLASLPFLYTTDLLWPLMALFALVQLWVLLLAGRLLFGRLPIEFLRASTHSNSVVAMGLFVVLLDAWLLTQGLAIGAVPYRTLLIVLMLFSAAVGMGFLYQIIWTLKHFRLRGLDQTLAPRDMPTVTLAIPARNETHALEACLQAVIASDYPKLEILVLDDCSQDKTSQIIRSFAQDGVRFVQGDAPAEGWLGKNQAERTLAQQASGDFILFTDVDTHLQPQSIRELVMFALSNKLDMVTVLPYRRDGWSLSTLLTSLRYYWQVCLPVTARRVPVATQCWLIRRKTLNDLGGFDAVRQKITPEGYFARNLIVADGYRFIIANEDLGITTAKKWTSQIETAIRFLYPTFKRQPFLVLLGTLLLGGLMILPFVVMLAAAQDAPLFTVAAVAGGVMWFGYGLVVMRTHPLTWPLTLLLMPISLILEFVLLLASMLTYEFGDVNWKGRNVCYPVISMNPGAPQDRRR